MGSDTRRRVVVALAFTASLASACASRSAPPPVPGALRYPDFIFPVVPAGFSDRPTVERYDRAWQYLQSGDTGRAERELLALIKRTPKFYPAEAALGYVQLAGRNDRDAVGRFDRALQQAPQYVPALVGRGQALLALDRNADALASFEAALAVDRSLTDIARRIEVLRFRGMQEYLAAARAAAEAGRLAEAREAYTRALAASPDSAFLYRELGTIDRRLGDMDAAVEHFTKATALDPVDAASAQQVGEILEARGDAAGALKWYSASVAMEPSDILQGRIALLRARLDFERMPAEYRAIPDAPTLTRGDLAALVGVRLAGLLKAARPRDAVVITDTRTNWASEWIMMVVRAGVMEVYANHTFQPRGAVRRGDLALAVSRLLNLIAAGRPALARTWQNARQRITDVSTGHLSYPAASLSVSAGVLPLLQGDTFQLNRPVTGAEAIEAISRLQLLNGPAETRGPQ